MLSNDLINFIKTLYPSQEKISLHEPSFDANDKNLVLDAIKSTFVSSSGKYLEEFEHEICSFTGAKFCSVFMNGTSALHLALLGNHVNSSHEVITQSFTFVATLNAISYVGATPLLADICEDDLGIDSLKLRSWLSKNSHQKNGECVNKVTGKTIKACLLMHSFGIPSNILEIQKVCLDFNITLIEDCAESLGSFSNKTHLGLFGKCGILSFNGNKLITTGGGGAIISNDSYLMSQITHLGSTAKLKHDFEFIHDRIGYNYRMPNLNAALGVSQIKKIENYLFLKKQISDSYKNFFSAYSDVKYCDSARSIDDSNYWLNTIIFNKQEMRDQVLHDLLRNNIFARIPWKPMHQLKIHKSIQMDELLITDNIYSKALNLPSSPNL